MSKKRRSETDEERKERKRAKKEAKKRKKKERKGIEGSSSNISVDDSPPISLTPNKEKDQSTAFQQKRLRMVVSLFPVALSNVLSHVRENLRSLLLKYSDGVGGVLLGFDNVTFSKNDSSGVILDELPHIHYTIELNALVFCPKVGSKLTGAVNECFPSHVGMLVHSFFNAMVSSDHLHSAGYVFDRDLQQWMQEKEPKVLGNDDKVDFVVEKIHECEGVISIEGSHPAVQMAAI